MPLYRFFRSQAAMEKHANEKHDNILEREKVHCIFCEVAYLDNMVLNSHVRRKHKRVAYFCPRLNCGKYYKSDAEVQAHVKEIHENAPNDDKIACNYCGCMISTLR
jgi:hypothetical protein